MGEIGISRPATRRPVSSLERLENSRLAALLILVMILLIIFFSFYVLYRLETG